MPENKQTLVRPDGTLIQVNADQANRLRILGYKPETEESQSARIAASADEDSYQTAGDKVKTVVEGVGRGLTFGATDVAFGDYETEQRQAHNPGLAMGSEIVGAVAPVLLSGGTGAVARGAGLLPTARVAEGAAGLAEGLGLESRVARGVVQGGAEGAVYGGTNVVARSQLTGDPLTAESVLHGVGMGVLLGGGLGGIGGALEGYAGRAATREAAAETAPAHTDLFKAADREWANVNTELAGLKTAISEARRGADSIVAESEAAIGKAAYKFTPDQAPGLREASQSIPEIRRAYSNAIKAASSGNPTKLELAIETLNEHSGRVDSALGAIDLGMSVKPTKALTDLATLTAASRELSRLPKTASEFAAMSPKRLQSLEASLDAVRKTQAFPEIAAGLDKSFKEFAGAVGVTDTSVSSVHTALADALKVSKSAPKSAVEVSSGPGPVRKVASWLLGAKATGLGAAVGGPVAGFAAGNAVRRVVNGDLLGPLVAAKNAVSARLSSAASAYVPRAGKALRRVAPQVEPLKKTLDGRVDPENNRQKLAANRIKEMYNAAPNFNDRAFRAVEPIAAVQPELGPAMFNSMVSGFQTMLKVLPKDPGVVSGLKSIWSPSPLETEKVSRQWAVFQDPVGAAETMLNTGEFDPISIQVLKDYVPSLYQQLRIETLERVSSGGMLDDMAYQDQMGLCVMLDLNIHSSYRPEHIAQMQEIFTKRNEPMPTPGTGGESGASPDTNPMATKASMLTER